MTPHPITRIVLVQSLVVVLSFFTLAILMKIQGYPHATWLNWKSEAVWLRQYGWLAALLPLGWAMASLACERKWPHSVSTRIHVISGALVALAIYFNFLAVGLNPYTEPLIARVAKPSPREKIAKRFQAVEESMKLAEPRGP
jgi:hypothetical protein